MPSNLTGSNSTTIPPDAHRNFPALIFGILLIIVIICGNLLVCISVYTEKALKTTTNYFIISLAVSDLLLAVLVLPLFVYAEFQDGVWTLNMSICDALMTMDVMLCTASIFNLCAISVDRFIAVSVPLAYSRKHVDQRQILLLSGTWVLALAVASPVMFGINNVPGRVQNECKLEDNNYVIYSSVCSFFIPCPIMLLLYFGIFRGLRRWEQARKAKLRSSMQISQKLQDAAATATTTTTMPPPLLPGAQPPPPPQLPPTAIKRQLTNLNLHLAKQRKLTELKLEELDQDSDAEQSTVSPPPDHNHGPNLDRNHDGNLDRNSSQPVPAVAYPNLRPNQEPPRRNKINRRERKAMRVLPVVVGAFLFCWTPFFVVHMLGAVCDTCEVPSKLMSTVTWLGYVNSAVNPIIYTVFNTEFRKFFKKFLPRCR